MLVIVTPKDQARLARLLSCVDCVNDDRFAGFGPGAVSIRQIGTNRHHIAVCLDICVAGKADQAGPFQTLNVRTKQRMLTYITCRERVRFTPLFGPTPDIRLFYGNGTAEEIEKALTRLSSLPGALR